MLYLSSMAAIGGFDYVFVDEVSEELKCSICLQVFRDPNLTSCCGNRYCRKCIEKVVQNRMPCPLCQRCDFTLMLDKLFLRKVNSLRVKCPNTKLGCEWRGDLGKVEEHENVCQAKTGVPCDFHAMGCETRVPLAKMEDHLNKTLRKHLALMLQAIQDKDKQIAKLEQKVSCLQSEVTSLQNDLKKFSVSLRGPKRYPPVDLVMYNYNMFKGSEMEWNSDGFYTHPNGYQMCLTVFANGVGRGRDSHVSVFATLMKGEYDDDLNWPFRGQIAVELLESDFFYTNTEIEDVFRFNARTPPRAKSRPVDDRNEYGHGNAEFLPHFIIPYSVDVLRFRVTNVTVL